MSLAGDGYYLAILLFSRYILPTEVSSNSRIKCTFSAVAKSICIVLAVQKNYHTYNTCSKFKYDSKANENSSKRLIFISRSMLQDFLLKSFYGVFIQSQRC